VSKLPQHFAIAQKIIERAERGIPQDRWIRGDHEMVAFVKAMIDLSDAYAHLHKEMINRGSESMSIDPENT
tara:strand:+ start:1314 stop:1526 length:213 start_codon:yes stop_codon:yes gene_type:complete